MASGNPLAPTNIVDPKENYKGLSYGNIISIWTNWLVSAEVDYSETTDILFLRGNVGHYQNLTKTDPLDRTAENAQFIYFGTSIFIPIICTFLRLGDYYEGNKIESEMGLRNAVFRSVGSGGDMWAKIRYLSDTSTSLYDIAPISLTDFYFETPVYKLEVPEGSKLKDEFAEKLEPGCYEAVTGGYFILLKGLTPETYRIRFGGKGKGVYFTDSIYDITVLSQQLQNPRSDAVARLSPVTPRNSFGM